MLAALVKDNDVDVRQAAAHTLGEVAKVALPEMVTELLALLAALVKDNDVDVRQAAAQALREVAKVASLEEVVTELLALLAALLKDNDVDVRITAAKAFLSLMDDKVIPWKNLHASLWQTLTDPTSTLIQLEIQGLIVGALAIELKADFDQQFYEASQAIQQVLKLEQNQHIPLSSVINSSLNTTPPSTSLAASYNQHGFLRSPPSSLTQPAFLSDSNDDSSPAISIKTSKQEEDEIKTPAAPISSVLDEISPLVDNIQVQAKNAVFADDPVLQQAIEESLQDQQQYEYKVPQTKQ